MATGEQLLRIANRQSALMRECFGRGPARARAYREDSFLFVVLEGSFRDSFQDVLAPQMIEVVEDCLGVPVRDAMSQVLTRTGVVVEIFQLAGPAESSGSL
jgi:uncharacterized protein YbcI